MLTLYTLARGVTKQLNSVSFSFPISHSPFFLHIIHYFTQTFNSLACVTFAFTLAHSADGLVGLLRYSFATPRSADGVAAHLTKVKRNKGAAHIYYDVSYLNAFTFTLRENFDVCLKKSYQSRRLLSSRGQKFFCSCPFFIHCFLSF